MFEDRMSEDLVLVQLDLDTLFDDVSTHGLIIPICHQVEAWGVDNLEMVWQDSLEVTGVIDSLRRRIESGEYITINIASPLQC